MVRRARARPRKKFFPGLAQPCRSAALFGLVAQPSSESGVPAGNTPEEPFRVPPRSVRGATARDDGRAVRAAAGRHDLSAMIRRPHDLRVAAALVFVGLVAATAMAASAALIFATLDAHERTTLGELVGNRLPLAFIVWAAVLALALPPLRVAHRWLFAAPAELASAARALAEGGQVALPVEGGSAETRALAAVISELAAQRSLLRDSVAQQVRAGGRQLERERARLAALMSELAQSVVVCALDGRVVLYNRRARALARSLSDAPASFDGTELLGLGRSIHTLLDRAPVVHALDSVRARRAVGDDAASAQFVVPCRGGPLLRVRLAPLPAGDAGAPQELAGFVLVLDDITREYADDCARDQLLLDLDADCRATLGQMQAAADALARQTDPSAQARALGQMREAGADMAARLRGVAEQAQRAAVTRWPLEDIRGADLIDAALRRIAAPQLRAGEVDGRLWLRADSFALLQALDWLARRLADEYDVRVATLALSAAPEGAYARLDLIWQGRSMSTDTVMAWQMEAMDSGDRRTPLSVRDVIERHGGAFAVERERASHRTLFRLVLPCAPAPAPAAERVPDSAGSYDFGLLDAACADAGETALAALTCTVFDTETTGLDPSGGDEIVQIGATRVVRGRLLREESFEQRIDPKRPVPAASSAVHGLRTDDLRGQPVIDAVLPAFHAYAQDSVLVAHNAAFDLRFIELKQARCGLHFGQPVLDTLLLSALAQPEQPSHRLEDIAERFGLDTGGRHSALGDALLTAEVFLRLLPLLEARGLRTLDQVLAASRATDLAKLRY